MKKSKLKRKLRIVRVSVVMSGILFFYIILSGLNNAGNTKGQTTAAAEMEETSTIIPREFTLIPEDYKSETSIPERITGRVSTAEQDVSARSPQYESRSTTSNDVFRNPQNFERTQTESAQVPSEFSLEGEQSYSQNSISTYRSDNHPITRALQRLENKTKNDQEKNEVNAHIMKGRSSGILVGSDQGGVFGKVNEHLKDAGNGGIRESIGSTLSNALGNMQGGMLANTGNTYEQQNSQAHNQQFLQSSRTSSDFITGQGNQDSFSDGDSSAEIVIAGTVIPIVMVTAINSDLPGMISARVTEDIYDSLYGTGIIIPKGSLVIGEYNSSLSWGQKRVLMAWQRLTRPDGYSIVLENMQGISKEGAAGLTGKVKTHIGASMLAAALTSVFGLGVHYASYRADEVDTSQTLSQFINATGAGVGSTIQSLADKFLNKQPTIYIKPGTKSYIFVNKDIMIPRFLARSKER